MAEAAQSLPYTVMSSSSSYERMFWLLHRLGQQSNILVIARYHSPGFQLTRAAVIAALSVVIERHPALACVWVTRPSPKRGKTRLHRALLLAIDVSSCVEFVDQEDFGAEDLEHFHNQWWAQTDEDAAHPWFKVVVSNSGSIAFVYHHILGDGMSGYVFHREFLDVLNSMQWPYLPETNKSAIVAIDPARVVLSPDPLVLNKGWKDLFWPPLSMIWFILLPWLFPTWFFFTNLPKPKPITKSLSKTDEKAAPPPVVTRVVSYRISPAKMTRVLAACRANNTTFTSLLIVMWLVSLSVDIYPNAHIAFSRFAVSIRPHLVEMAGGTKAGIFTQGASGIQYAQQASPFRRVVVRNGDERNPSVFDVAAVWKLVQAYKKKLPPMASEALLGRYRSASMISEDLESQIDMTYGMFKAMRLTPHVSNLGTFNPHMPGESVDEIGSKKWSVDDVQFSVGCTNGNLGSHCPVLSVSGIQDGDTVINISYEETAYPSQDAVISMMNKLIEKIFSLVEATENEKFTT